ncbi:MAG: hypothetical protein WAL98_15490 [Desulfatiglandaceae bacterium]
MYALIYDEREPNKKAKEVFSVHETREEAEKALEERQKTLERRVWECHTRIVWVDGTAKKGDFISTSSFSTWRPGEKIPEGELYTDGD